MAFREAGIERARKLLERERKKEQALERVLRHEENDPSIIASLHIRKTLVDERNQGNNPNKGLSREQVSSAHNPIQLESRKSSQLSKTPQPRDEARLSQKNFRDELQRQVEEKKSALEKQVAIDVEFSKTIDSQVQKAQTEDLEKKKNTLSRRQKEAADVLRQSKEKHQYFLDQARQRRQAEAADIQSLDNELMDQSQVILSRKRGALEFVKQDISRRQQEVAILRKSVVSENDKHEASAREREDVLSKREEARLQGRMKARDRQSHHIAIYEKVVQEAERKLKENDELIEKERQEIDRKKAERDEREKKHRKEEALSVQKALIDQMNEKKRIKVSARKQTF
eukprot:TRINITY_DN4724_c0_g1_i2.p1 TRINITY_DN4724_c0_g1~~TRINITY_DN4724_c0_g1_i2.p1  ORF type:complete len:342 (-),score=85.36 TRINITY_DN4724_c0_g1_i2:287-1312(-)